MPLNILVGAQWGDEGKGRIVDLLAAKANIVARYNGGDNAGHTVTVGDQTFKLHLIPSGIIHPAPVGVLGSGMVINPTTLLQEMQMLRDNGIEINPERLKIAYNAHLITPAHRALDQAQEAARGKGQIGTTGRGIGPAYTDKAARQGLRVQDILDLPAFIKKITAHINEKNFILDRLYGAAPLNAGDIAQEYADYARQLAPYVDDVSSRVAEAVKCGEYVLAEGAQGTLLDLDQGTYPYVTSSYPTAAGVLLGLGLGICPVERVIGITKAFQTRVGAGPFPTEVFDTTAERLRGSGANPWDEYGTTTGRPRRVGWLDGVLLRYAVRVNGITELVLTKLDVLTGFDTLRICVAYRAGGQVYHDLPMGPADLSPFEPIYEDLSGWDENLWRVRGWEDLPVAARNYLLRIEELTGVPIRLVSVGPEREQVVETPSD